MSTTQLVRPNPAMTKGFERAATGPIQTDAMTLNGTLGCTAVLMFLVVTFGALGWNVPNQLAGMAALFIALGFALVTAFKPHLAPKTAPIYAAIEGYFLGWISQVFDQAYDGIVIMAIGLTLCIALVLLGVYRTGIIPVTQNFRLGVAAATGGVFLIYMLSFVGGMFGFDVPVIHDSSGWGIAFSVFVIVLASANLVIDFDFIEHGAENGAPKYMEWYGAFGLVVTLVWLYLELLRLLAKLQQR